MSLPDMQAGLRGDLTGAPGCGRADPPPPVLLMFLHTALSPHRLPRGSQMLLDKCPSWRDAASGRGQGPRLQTGPPGFSQRLWDRTRLDRTGHSGQQGAQPPRDEARARLEPPPGASRHGLRLEQLSRLLLA